MAQMYTIYNNQINERRKREAKERRRKLFRKYLKEQRQREQRRRELDEAIREEIAQDDIIVDIVRRGEKAYLPVPEQWRNHLGMQGLNPLHEGDAVCCWFEAGDSEDDEHFSLRGIESLDPDYNYECEFGTIQPAFIVINHDEPEYYYTAHNYMSRGVDENLYSSIVRTDVPGHEGEWLVEMVYSLKDYLDGLDSVKLTNARRLATGFSSEIVVSAAEPL